MTATPLFPASHEEFLRIVATSREGRAEAVHAASHEEFLRICCANERERAA